MNLNGICISILCIFKAGTVFSTDEAKLPCEHLLEKKVLRSSQSLALMTCLQTISWQVPDPLTAHVSHAFQVPGRHMLPNQGSVHACGIADTCDVEHAQLKFWFMSVPTDALGPSAASCGVYTSCWTLSSTLQA